MEEIKRDRILTIPNILTMVRIALLPAVVWRYRIGDSLGALLAYMIAMLTDAIDGIIARRFNQITALGKLLDPIADKLSLVTLLWLFVADGQISWWILGIVLIKECCMIIGAGIALKHGIVVYAHSIGKVTTVAFVASIILRFINVQPAADILLFISVVLSLAAFVWYSRDLKSKLDAKEAETAK